MRRLWDMYARLSSWLSVLAIGIALPAVAQTALIDRNAVVVDPAHGGTDAGGRISEQVQEKDVTLAVAAKLRPLLAAKGFNVAMTRNSDMDAAGTDQRAEMANRSHAVACLVLHASTGTSGVVLGTSALGTALMRTRGAVGERPQAAVRWSRAQEVYVVQSDRLANQVGTALARADIPVTIMRVEMRPLDSLTCPAISVELGVLGEPGAAKLQVSDDGYQQRVAESIAEALALWRKLAEPPESAQTAASRESGRRVEGGTP